MKDHNNHMTSVYCQGDYKVGKIFNMDMKGMSSKERLSLLRMVLSDDPQDVEFDEVEDEPPPAPTKGIVVSNVALEVQVLELLDKLMEGKTNKDAAIIIQAALLACAILRPSYRQFCNRYGEAIISKTLYNRYVGISKRVFLEADLEPIIAKFKSLGT